MCKSIMDKTRENDILEKGVFEVIETVAKKVTEKTLEERGIESTFDAIVVAVDNDNKTADVGYGDRVLNALPNKSGEDLKVGDAVRVFAKSNFLTDMYIGATVTMRKI